MGGKPLLSSTMRWRDKAKSAKTNPAQRKALIQSRSDSKAVLDIADAFESADARLCPGKRGGIHHDLTIPDIEVSAPRNHGETKLIARVGS